jgi:hypothetical protein
VSEIGLVVNEEEIILSIVDDSPIELSVVEAGPIATLDINQGAPGLSWQEEFETVSKNLKSWNAAFNYTTGLLTSIVYTSGAQTITKTFNRTAGALTSIVLSGDTPSGIDLTKTLNYTTSVLTSISYS